jgi:tRNA1Val (adenine37-N6)-methyltransferase
VELVYKMPNPFFSFRKFTVFHDQCAMKVTTDACLFGAWCAREIQSMNKKDAHLLDIGTGTGLLSLMIAQKNDLFTDAVEIDKMAARQAINNIEASPWNNSIDVINEDILKFPISGYDYVVSNPPFYEREIISGKETRDIAHHSTYLSLKEVLKIIRDKLNDTGIFFLLLPYKRINEIEKLLVENKLYTTQQVVVRQTDRHQPIRLMIQGSLKQNASPVLSELIINDQSNQYSTDFQNLLKDYYLYL